MHNLIALSLALPGTPLHGLDDFDARAPMPPTPSPAGRAATPATRAASRLPRARRRGRRLSRPAPATQRECQGGPSPVQR